MTNVTNNPANRNKNVTNKRLTFTILCYVNELIQKGMLKKSETGGKSTFDS